MRVEVRLRIVGNAGEIICDDANVLVIDKCHDRLEAIGLSLDEDKEFLAGVQQHLVAAQAAAFATDHRCCTHCGRSLRRKGRATLTFRTPFGNVPIDSPRPHRCRCAAAAAEEGAQTFSPLTSLLASHIASELLYLESKWASFVSYSMTVDLLRDVLPIDTRLNPKTVRNHLHRMAEHLCSQGLQLNQAVTFLTDGGDDVRNLAAEMAPYAEHHLDWFHITMRLTVLGQYAKSLIHHDPKAGERIARNLLRIKRFLWHGNSRAGLFWSQDLADDLYGLEEDCSYPNLKAFSQAIAEFATYIERNAHAIANYGERYRNDERIATPFVESAVNVVIAKRFTKKQQMQWSRRGAHMLLQIRTRTLDGTRRGQFETWCPGLSANDDQTSTQAAAA